MTHFMWASVQSVNGGWVERTRIHVPWSPVLLFHSQWLSRALFHLLVLVHWILQSPESKQPSSWIYPLADKPFWRYWFHFLAECDTSPHSRKCRLSNWPYLNHTENLCGIVKMKIPGIRAPGLTDVFPNTLSKRLKGSYGKVF